jgi:hypothetical protein
MAYVLQCADADFDAATGTCAAPFYGDAPSAIPTLSIADAMQIGLAIALLWGIAYGFRMVKRLLTEIG